GIGFGAEMPAARTFCLEQKYVVEVVVGAHTSLIRGVADHDVVETPVGEKPEVVFEYRNFRNPLVYRLHQQGPVGFWQGEEILFGKRTVAQLPRSVDAMLLDDTGFNPLFQRHTGEL